MSKYLEFKEIPYDGKTKKFEVTSTKHDSLLGEIKWFGRWRQYGFFPELDTVWNKDCLKTIQDFLQKLMDERKHV